MRYCPLCDSETAEFEAHNGKPNRRCPTCRSLGRQRLAWSYLQRETDLFEPPAKYLLQLAPESALERRLAPHSNIHYLSGDLSSPKALVKCDLTALPFIDDTFDVLLCSHVLEHVKDDHQAMREMFRVLRPGRWALIQVPVLADRTDEDSRVKTAAERLARFGQHDHVRIYGLDVADRLQEVGFDVSVEKYGRTLGKEMSQRLGIGRSQYLFVCRKPAAGA